MVSLRGLVDEIVVVDDFSTDETADKCRALGAKVVQRKLDGFGAQKQFALEQTSGEWALSIDADERITPSLAAEISATLEHPKADGYFVRRNFYFLGHLLRHGGLDRDWVLRLFRRQKGHFENVPVHESIQVEGVTAKLSNPLEHYSYASLAEYNEKCERYTELAAQEAWRNKNGFLRSFIYARLGSSFAR